VRPAAKLSTNVVVTTLNCRTASVEQANAAGADDAQEGRGADAGVEQVEDVGDDGLDGGQQRGHEEDLRVGRTGGSQGGARSRVDLFDGVGDELAEQADSSDAQGDGAGDLPRSVMTTRAIAKISSGSAWATSHTRVVD